VGLGVEDGRLEVEGLRRGK
jgi:hypothetical protein